MAFGIGQKIDTIIEDIKEGARKADRVQAGLYGQHATSAKGTAAGATNKNYKPGSANVGEGLGYGQSILDPRFKRSMAEAGVTFRQTPAQFLGAYASRLAVDAANDGTRTYWWRYNHPLAVAQAGVERGINANLVGSPTGRALIGLGIAIPAISAAGTYDITNPEEQFRPKGYAQSYAPEGAEDRRISEQPVQEMFERFFLGRTGKPLKYETAKQDIPDLTPERYGNYMNYLYNDKGLLNLGIIKGTMENLQGVPEVRMLGFPATLPMAGAFAGGTLAAREAVKQASAANLKPSRRIGAGIAGGIAGSLAGIATGNLINSAVAAANRPKLPTISEYQGEQTQL